MLGNYHLLVKFGDTIIPISTSILRELTIIQDINKFLPEVRFRIDDTTGAFTHIFPFDKNMSVVSFELGHDISIDNKNIFSFDIYRRQPGGTQSTPSTEYDIQGLLVTPKLFSPSYSRAHTGSIKTSLETIGTDELQVSSNEISPSLDYSKTLLQPNWNNCHLLKYLQDNLIGVNNEYGYKGFIKVYKGKTSLVFKSILEMIQEEVSYKFVLSDVSYENFLPIYEYYIYDNYKLNEVFSSKQQCYSYYDYTTSTFTKAAESVEDYLSLSDYFLIDQSDSIDNNCATVTGRSNDFTSDFKGKIKGRYGNKLLGSVKMWITTQGLPNACPGQTILIFFPQSVQANSLYSYQYAGYWLVERVVHNCGDAFFTKLLLTRHGLDTDKKTTLLKATTKKKS